MPRTEQNLLYYLDKEPDGCFVAEENGNIVGCIFSHTLGSLGWFGPLEVATDMQNRGIGKQLVTRSVQHMRENGCKTIGLETMSSSNKNITFYVKQAFAPHHLSYVLFKKLSQNPPQFKSLARSLDISTDLAACRRLWGEIIPELDYTSEFESTESKKLGRILAIDENDGLAHAIVHTYEMFDNSQNAVLKLLVSKEKDTASDLLAQCENIAIAESKSGMFLRTYAATPPGLDFFLKRGYVLQSTSIRMISEGPDESGDRVHVSCWSG